MPHITICTPPQQSQPLWTLTPGTSVTFKNEGAGTGSAIVVSLNVRVVVNGADHTGVTAASQAYNPNRKTCPHIRSLNAEMSVKGYGRGKPSDAVQWSTRATSHF